MVQLDDMVSQLTHICDGPVTAFVVLSRATKAVADGADAEMVANAINEVLATNMREEIFTDS